MIFGLQDSAARPQMVLSCSLCPTGQMEDENSHLEVSLVFFSTFEPISLPRQLLAEKWYSQAFRAGSLSASNSLCVPCGKRSWSCTAASVLMMGNKQNTIPHALRYEIPHGAAVDSKPNCGTGSSLFEVNIWMWRDRWTGIP